MDKKRLEAHMNDGKTEYVMCAAIHVNDEESYSYASLGKPWPKSRIPSNVSHPEHEP